MASDDEPIQERRDEPGPKPARDRNGRWLRGCVSPNPAGRAVGSRNRASLAVDALLDGEAEALTRRAIELAKGGDTVALRLCLERLAPPRRSRPVHLAWPAITNLEEVDLATTALLQSVALGELAIEDASGIAALLAEKRHSLAAVELERRLRVLESRDITDIEAQILGDAA